MERPWKVWSGGPCPVAKGTMVQIVDEGGRTSEPFPALCIYGGMYVPDLDWTEDFCCWRWGKSTLEENHIIAWRLAGEDAEKADQAERAARMAGFRKMADIAPFELPHPEPLPIPAPAREVEEARYPDNWINLIGKRGGDGPAFICSSPEELASLMGFQQVFFTCKPLTEPLSPKNRAGNSLARARARRKAGDQ